MREGVRRMRIERVILLKKQVGITLIALLDQNTELAITHMLYYPD